MIKFAKVIRRNNIAVIDGYSDRKTVKGAITEIGKWIAKNVDKSEGETIAKYGIESLARNAYNNEYCFEIEDVPCASLMDEETDEIQYDDANFYFLTRIILG